MIESNSFERRFPLDLPTGQSCFLWGARKTGKSTYLKARFPSSIYYDLLKSDEYMRLLKEPHLLREEIIALPKTALEQPIIIDEVQKIPLLLDEVHYLIENTNAYFILCGSSARKLKQAGVNLLGGRAWCYTFYPLVYPEIPGFDLLHALNVGLIPSHYTSNQWRKSVTAYVDLYLREEIQQEGLVRHLDSFARFLDVAAFSNGELINHSNIAQDCGIDSKTVKSYYDILEDTLLGYRLTPYINRKKRDVFSKLSKFYFFDVGITNALTKRSINSLQGMEAGHAFEHYILMELIAYRGISDKDFDITYWRTPTGIEVDFVLGDAAVSIEVKIRDTIKSSDTRGLLAFYKKYQPKRSLLVCTAPRKRLSTVADQMPLEIYPWAQFLEELWAGEII